MKLSFEDFFTGYIYGIASAFMIDWRWAIFVACLSGLLWALGGAGWLGLNGWRRFGCPLVLFVACKWHNPSVWPYIGLWLSFAALHIGYGLPSAQPPDAGSWLGRTFGKWTRVVWFVILALATAPMFF